MPVSENFEFAHVLNSGGRKTKEFLKLTPQDVRNHILLVGGSGSGKTHFARALLEEIILKGIPTIVLDSQGDLLWLTQPAGSSTPGKKKLRKLQKRIFTPNYSNGPPFVIAPVLFPGRSEINLQLIRYWVRSILRTVGYDLRPGQTSPQEYQLTKVSEKISSDAKDLALDSLFDGASKQALKWTTDKMAPIRPEDAWELVSRLGALLGGIDHPLYHGKGFDVGRLTKSGKGGLWIIFSVHLSIETRQLVLNWVCDSIYHWMMSGKSIKIGTRPRLIMFIDEAADYVTEANRLEHRESLFRLLNQGRKYGVGLILTVQTPRFLPPEVLNNCAIKMFGAVDEPGDLQSVMHSTGLYEKELDPLRNRTWKNAFVVRIPGAQAQFCKARALLSKKGHPLALGSSEMVGILKSLKQFRSSKAV
jgi:hypothetical protein